MVKKHKGAVYYATMILGFGIIGAQTGGEVLYWKYFKTDRDEELKEVSQ